MKPGNDTNTLDQQLIHLTAYLLSAGHGLIGEPREYAPMRCADGARRTLRILESVGPVDPRLIAMRERLDRLLFTPDHEGHWAETLDELCEQLATCISTPPEPAP
ncbi:DUF6092 family protein [Streptomyces sp. LP05-1]|uniref:DUF6092 family protein n=1 Tax=Streptomyces pyxinae TaxID=2970734 RepID=A0ABT2CJE3_9ACTN|nr:DUF6092 family protein [Streptomyces sp. LP05-1]MCS0637541.1 DUF6092 family protein [Streptomyces sp. LP05-1]